MDTVKVELPRRMEEPDHTAGFTIVLVLVIAVIAFIAISAVCAGRKKLTPRKDLPTLKKPGIVDTLFGDDRDNPWQNDSTRR